MFLILACATLFVVILYSPIGSSDNYSQSQYFAPNQGVSFSGRILNASRNRSFNSNGSGSGLMSMNGLGSSADFKENPNISIENNNIDATMPEYNSTKKSTAKYSVANTNSAGSSHENATYAVSMKSNVISNQNSGASGGGGIGNGSAAIIGKTSEGNNDNSNPQLNGFIALNVDLSVFSDLTTTKAGVGYTPGSGATDPGEDPIGEPIPVPDGFWMLLFMAVGYSGLKMFKRKKLEQV
ncbi:MAG: hypothetical protein WCJ61_00775 [Paludibacter sp.]